MTYTVVVSQDAKIKKLDNDEVSARDVSQLTR
jgi:hypothetical protein